MNKEQAKFPEPGQRVALWVDDKYAGRYTVLDLETMAENPAYVEWADIVLMGTKQLHVTEALFRYEREGNSSFRLSSSLKDRLEEGKVFRGRYAIASIGIRPYLEREFSTDSLYLFLQSVGAD